MTADDTTTPATTTPDPKTRRARLPDKTGASRTRQTLKLDDGYLPLMELAIYSGLSLRFLQALITRPVNPLPHYRFGTKIEVRRSEFDAWAKEHHRVATEPVDIKALVDARIAGRKPR